MLSDPLVANIQDRVHERQKRWKTEVLHVFPDYRMMDEPVLVGTYSLVLQRSRKRLLVAAQPTDLVQVNGVVESPSAVARDYLREVFPRWRKHSCWRIVTARWTRPLELPEPYHPIYARRCSFFDGYYLDIEAFWYHTLCRFGWDVVYAPGLFVGYGRSADDYPWFTHKVSRNSLVTVGFPKRLVRWDPVMGHSTVDVVNDLLNLPLAHFISDVMHYLASVAVELGAVYWYIDAAIAPDERTAAKIRAAIEEHGYRCHVKARGPGWVGGPGWYAVGNKMSRKPAEVGDFSNLRRLDDVERALLRKHLAGR